MKMNPSANESPVTLVLIRYITVLSRGARFG